MYFYHFFFYIRFTCFITGCITQLDGKRRQKSIYSKKTEINYINFVTEDGDEKEGVLAVGWETVELVIHYLIFLSRGWEGCISTFLQYFGQEKNDIKFIANTLIHHFLPTIDKLNKKKLIPLINNNNIN